MPDERNIEIWIMDFDNCLAFEWNESKTVNIYPLLISSDRQSYGHFGVGEVMECTESAAPMDFDYFKEWVEDFGKEDEVEQHPLRPMDE